MRKFSKRTILVCVGYYDKIPETGWLTNNTLLFLTVLEAAKSKITAPADLEFGKSLQMVIAAMKLKAAYSLEGKFWLT